LHWKISHLVAVVLKTLATVEDRFVLGDSSDDVVALFAIHLRRAFDGQVVAFRGAGGKNNFLGERANDPGNLLARGFDRGLHFPSELMAAAGCIPKFAGEIRHHGLQHPRI
jgi:hypothetical protein